MKIAALTMVYRDYWALSRWYAHHGAQIGFENLFIVAHGADPKIAQICPKASILTIARDKFDDFDKTRAELLNGIHAGLDAVYDWVIRSDADELICFDPDRYASLGEAIAANADVPVLTALGFDLVEMLSDTPMQEGPVFAQRRQIGFNGHYSKAVASRRAIDFSLHGVRVAARRLEAFPFSMPRGLFLAHLKYASQAALVDGTTVRMEVGNAEGRGLPGAGWQAADEDAVKFMANFSEKPVLSWDKAEAKAHATLSVKPARLERYNLVKTRALKLPYRTELPTRLSDQG
ncbi:glycosyltransferase family 2 protein [uncultured Pelagimonas sp.]|uniref:glycosyltransferase family 2 protein n=1 Tax=uncultured Pelagimonas sp. TaxID=1618102 RepID=UPI002618A8F5|nr:glycosyltransferase family 2 protein [uncultured Pelagimonas sp.]